jgi:hypothetical protein
MSNLVPTPRTDKNGRTVTRHMKPQNTPTLKAKLPAPLASTQQAQRTKELASLLDTNLMLSPKEMFKLRNKLDTYKDPTTYDLIQEAAERNNASLFPQFNYMYKLIILNPEQNVRETCHYRELIDKQLGTTELHGYVNGLHLLDRYKNTKLEDLTGAELDTAVSLINIAATLKEHAPDELTNDDDRAVTFRNPELTDLILENPQHGPSIISYIEERHTADPTALREYLNNATALNNGVL